MVVVQIAATSGRSCVKLLESLAYSSLWVAGAAAALTAAASQGMGVALSGPVLGLVFCGTLVVYNVDRLRDLPQDFATAPLRSAFVRRHRTGLRGLVVVALAGSFVLARVLDPPALGALGVVAALGLLHRRLKRFALWKPFYVSAAWVVVCVGVPALQGECPAHVGWVAAVIGLSILANVIASNLRDGEAVMAAWGAQMPLRVARGVAASGVALALLAPGPLRPLLTVPLATAAALGPFRADERYGLLVVDGALWLGALGALALG